MHTVKYFIFWTSISPIWHYLCHDKELFSNLMNEIMTLLKARWILNAYNKVKYRNIL